MIFTRESFVGALGFGGSFAMSDLSHLGSLAVAAVTVLYLLRRWQLLERARRNSCADCPKRHDLIFPKDG